jgi:hypothetical protein
VKFVVMRSGGEPGEVAVNADLVTHVRSASGPFTDIYFRDHRVAVHGSFADVVKRLEYAAASTSGGAREPG